MPDEVDRSVRADGVEDGEEVVAQLLARSFRGTMLVAAVIGVVVSVAGVTTSYYTDTPSGGTIVLLAIGVFLLVAIGAGIRDRVARPDLPTGS